MEIINWTQKECYSDSWKQIIREASFSHPAKMARGQLRRILQWLLDTGAVKPGDTVLDPFGGIGSTGIESAYAGLQAVLCELEPKFFTLAQENFELHRRRWEALGAPIPKIINGDSRKLSELLAPVLAECCVSSPPFTESLSSGVLSETMKAEMASRGHKPSASGESAEYGSSAGQLGTMPTGAVEAVISSPPFQGSGTDDSRPYGGMAERREQGGNCCKTYGQTPGNLGNMPVADTLVSSPPYASGTVHDGNGIDQSKLTGNIAGKNSQAKAEGYGQTDGNLGNMPMGDALVSSPPWENGTSGHDQQFDEKRRTTAIAVANGARQGGPSAKEYGDSEGQLGREQAETFWQAASEIVRQCWLLLKSGATSAWVVKNFVRAGAIVDFVGDWSRLLESQDFQVTHHIRCWLISETKEDNLFGGVDVKKKSKKSFFRRLAEKRGLPAIDFEVVVVAKRI